MGRLPTRKAAVSVWMVIIVLCLLALFSFGYYHFAILEPEGHRYQQTLQAAAVNLERSSTILARDTERLLLEKSSHSQTDIQKLATKLQDTKRQLDAFKDASDGLHSWNYAFTSPAYQKSLTLKDQSNATADQIYEVLDEYGQFLSFLQEYEPLKQRLDDELAYVNSLTDLDVLAGFHQQQLIIAQALRSKAGAIAALKVPRGFEELVAASITLHQRTAAGFEALADGLFPPVDAKIYSAVGELEMASKERDTLEGPVFDRSLQASPALRHIQELPEKLERFMP